MNVTEEEGIIASEEKGPWQIVMFVFTIVMCVVATSGNGIVLLYNMSCKPRHKVKILEVLILNSALADFLVSCTFLPIVSIAYLKGAQVLEGKPCQVSVALYLAFLSISRISSFDIAVYCFIKCILKPMILFKLRTVIVHSLVTWVIAFAFYIPVASSDLLVPVYDRSFGHCKIQMAEGSFVLVLLIQVTTVYLPIVLTIAIYGIIFAWLRIHNNSMPQIGPMMKHASSAKATAGLLLIFLLCFLPLLIVKAIKEQAPDWVKRASTFAIQSSFALNPFYYMWRIPSVVPPVIARVFLKKTTVHPGPTPNVRGMLNHTMNDCTLPSQIYQHGANTLESTT